MKRILLAALMLLGSVIVPAQIATAAQAAAKFTLDTPITVLLADPKAKAVVEATIPQLMTHRNFDRVKHMSLRQIQRLTNGRMTDETLKKAEQGLAAIK